MCGDVESHELQGRDWELSLLSCPVESGTGSAIDLSVTCNLFSRLQTVSVAVRV